MFWLTGEKACFIISPWEELVSDRKKMLAVITICFHARHERFHKSYLQSSSDDFFFKATEA